MLTLIDDNVYNLVCYVGTHEFLGIVDTVEIHTYCVSTTHNKMLIDFHYTYSFRVSRNSSVRT